MQQQLNLDGLVSRSERQEETSSDKSEPSYSRDHKKASALILAGITVLLLGVGGAIAQVIPGPSLCAARDVEVVILIEDHGDANDLAPERLAKAGLTQMEARAACSEGRVSEGIAIYDEIKRSLGPMLSRNAR
jgi:hypothetical protein